MILKRYILSIAAVGLLIANQCLHAMVPNQNNDVAQTPFNRAKVAINFIKKSADVPYLSLIEVQSICQYALGIPENYADNVPSLTISDDRSTSDGRSTPVRRQLSQEEINRYNLYVQRKNEIRLLTSYFFEDIDDYKEFIPSKLDQKRKNMKNYLEPLLED